ncbi:MAG: glycosyltransferase [Planctomycetota bacterium]
MNEQPVICQLLHSLNVGGAEVLAARLARELRSRFRFTFACLDELGPMGRELRDEGFTVEVLERRPGIDFDCMRRLMKWWQREGVELVHAHQYTPFFYAAAARRFRSGPPILFTEHGRWFPDLPNRKRMIFNRLMLRRSDRVVGVGESVRRALVRNEGLPSRRVGVIYNGVDAAAFARNGHPAALVRAECGVAPDDFVVIQVARLDHLKDHVTAIRTIERLSKRCPQARLILVGDGPEQARIEAEIAERRVSANVRLMGLRSDVARLLHAADAFLLTSISEGIPVTVIEAMAAGLPVVSTNVGGVGEIVVDGRTGFLAPSGGDAALATALERLAADGALRRELGASGRQRAQTVFSQQEMHQAYAACYEEMLGG